MNLYGYGFGNPANLTDRLGLMASNCSEMLTWDEALQQWIVHVNCTPAGGRSPTNPNGTDPDDPDRPDGFDDGHGEGGGGRGGGGRDETAVDPDAIHDEIWDQFEKETPNPYDSHPSSYQVNGAAYGYAFETGALFAFTWGAPFLEGAGYYAWLLWALDVGHSYSHPNSFGEHARVSWQPSRRRPQRPVFEGRR